MPGHFWLLDRAGYRLNVQFYEIMLDAAQRAFVEGIDLDSLPEITAWSREKLRPELGSLFRFDEYIGMNVMRCIWHFLQGGWGLAGNVPFDGGAHDEHRGIFTLDVVEPYLAAEAELEVTELGAGLWTATDGTYRTMFMDAGDSVIAWDTFQTPGRARSYAKAIARTIPDKPIEWIVYSNDHLDRTGFAADLAPNAERIADHRCAELRRNGWIVLRIDVGDLRSIDPFVSDLRRAFRERGYTW